MGIAFRSSARKILNDAELKPNCTKGAGRVVIEISPFKVLRGGQGVIGEGVGESDDDNRRVAHAQRAHVREWSRLSSV